MILREKAGRDRDGLTHAASSSLGPSTSAHALLNSGAGGAADKSIRDKGAEGKGADKAAGAAPPASPRGGRASPAAALGSTLVSLFHVSGRSVTQRVWRQVVGSSAAGSHSLISEVGRGREGEGREEASCAPCPCWPSCPCSRRDAVACAGPLTAVPLPLTPRSRARAAASSRPKARRGDAGFLLYLLMRAVVDQVGPGRGGPRAERSRGGGLRSRRRVAAGSAGGVQARATGRAGPERLTPRAAPECHGRPPSCAAPCGGGWAQAYDVVRDFAIQLAEFERRVRKGAGARGGCRPCRCGAGSTAGPVPPPPRLIESLRASRG
jgi:hypothetical protein